MSVISETGPGNCDEMGEGNVFRRPVRSEPEIQVVLGHKGEEAKINDRGGRDKLPVPDLFDYADVDWVQTNDGYVVWRPGTGGNTEITHIKAFRFGGGERLLRAFLEAIQDSPPYGGKGTVFGFTRVGNESARKFYMRMGFSLSIVAHVYAEGQAIVFSAPWKYLCVKHGINTGEGE